MRLIALMGLVVVAGCGKGASSSDPGPAAEKPAMVSPLTLVGSAGRLTLGDSLDKAKEAFPAAPGAQIFNSAMSFAAITKEGWSWNLQPVAFEAASRGGKVVDIALVGDESKDEPSKTIAAIGAPTRKAEGKTASVYVWESGDYARFLITIRPGSSFIPAGTMTILGKKDDLKLLNYRADDPGTFVTQMDLASDQMNSPEMKKLMDDAKAKAKAKSGGK